MDSLQWEDVAPKLKALWMAWCVSSPMCAAVWLTELNRSHLPISVFQQVERVVLQSKFFLSLL